MCLCVNFLTIFAYRKFVNLHYSQKKNGHFNSIKNSPVMNANPLILFEQTDIPSKPIDIFRESHFNAKNVNRNFKQLLCPTNNRIAKLKSQKNIIKELKSLKKIHKIKFGLTPKSLMNSNAKNNKTNKFQQNLRNRKRVTINFIIAFLKGSSRISLLFGYIFTFNHS